MKAPLFLVDGHGLMFRSYYAHIKKPLRNAKGENTSAIHGFFQSIKKLYRDHHPTRIVIALDARMELERKKLYPDYKANRQKTPEDLTSQIIKIIDIMQAMQIPHLSVDGSEADDIIATLSRKAREEKESSVILSSDKDLFQLLGPGIQILRPTTKSSDWITVTPEWILENYGIEAEQVHDYLAIVGDSSDNIPGVAGIGPKTAVTLLKEYKTLDDIYTNLNNIKETWRKKLILAEEMARLSYTLVELNNAVPVPKDFTDEYPELHWERAETILDELDIHSLHSSSQRTQTVHSKSSSDNEPAFHSTVIKNFVELEEVVKKALDQNYISMLPVYEEQRALNATLTGLALSVEVDKAYYLPFRSPVNKEFPFLLESEKAACIKLLHKLFQSRKCSLIFHDAKQALSIFQNHGLSKAHGFFDYTKPSIAIVDTLIAAWLCSPENHHYDLAALCKTYKIPVANKDFLLPIDCSNVTDVEKLAESAGQQAAILLPLWTVLKAALQTANMYKDFVTVEMSISLLLSKIERKGIAIDRNYLRKLSAEFEQKLKALEQEIYSLSGETFNINSPRQLQEILFEKLKLPSSKKIKTGYSTDVHVLELLAAQHELPGKILEFRHISKLKNTYTDKLPEEINQQSGRVHTSLNQNGSETGRMSSTNPNLQNIPIKDKLGQQIRHAFIADKGSKLVSADYSQIELVVLAHLSKDKTLTEAFVQNIDIHTRTAARIFQKKEKDIDEKLRRIAKSINFGVIYGMSAFRLANELKIPHKLAQGFIKTYFNEFSSVTEFIASTIGNVEKYGYASTILGRRRYLKNINSKNRNLKNAADRMAINSVIQGSAADIMKLAMLRVEDALQQENLSSSIVLQIHDELLLECQKNEVKTVLDLLYRVMPNVYELTVPLKISAQSGDSWGRLA